MEILQSIYSYAQKQRQYYPVDEFTLRGFWEVGLKFRPNIHERLFNYVFGLVQTTYNGVSYYPEEMRPEIREEWIGEDAFTVLEQIEDINLKIAILDSIYGSFEKNPFKSHFRRGSPKEKALWRAKIVVNEVAQLAIRKNIDEPRVVNAGVVGNLIKGMRECNFEILASDCYSKIINTDMAGVTIEDCQKTLKLIEVSDIALITGMVISTGTMEEIIETAHENDVGVVVFAETGSNFGQKYLELGVDVVVSEYFPFYIFQGESQIDVFRKQ